MGSTLQTNIIAVGGLKNSGKTEAAAMFEYLLNTPKPFRTYWWYKRKIKFSKKWKITSFAKPLKEVLAIILKVRPETFESRSFKENCYVQLDTLQELYTNGIALPDKTLTDNQFNKYIKSGEPIPSDYWISVRQLMQYCGTNVLRKFLSDKLWINCTINTREKLIISDLRFRVELEEIKKRKGITIYIDRPGTQPGTHSSEREVIDLLNEDAFSYIITNNGDLKDLFNKINKCIQYFGLYS